MEAIHDYRTPGQRRRSRYEVRARRRPLSAQVHASRNGRRRRPNAERELAVRQRRSARGRRRDLRAQRLHPHRQRRADRSRHALCRDGPRDLHLDPDADRGRARSGPRSGASGACSARHKAVWQPRARRHPGDRRLDFDPRAWKPLREAGAVARTILVSAAAKRWNVDPASCHAQRGEVLHPPTGRAPAMASSPPTPRSCLSRKHSAQAAAGFHADRHPGEAIGYAGEGQWNGRLWHRRSPAGDEDRHARAVAGLWRSREECG